MSNSTLSARELGKIAGTGPGEIARIAAALGIAGADYGRREVLAIMGRFPPERQAAAMSIQAEKESPQERKGDVKS